MGGLGSMIARPRSIVLLLSIGLLLSSQSAVAQQAADSSPCEAWQQIGPKVSVGSMSYDSHRRVCVMVLPPQYYLDRTDTWEWDGFRWRLRRFDGPNVGATLCYDSTRRVCVSYNGTDGTLWEWDGDKWIQRNVTSPSPRTGAGFVYDSTRRLCVLFGGRFPTGTYTDETWEFDGEEWVERKIPGPTPRAVSGAMAFDSDRNVAVLFGGRGPNGGTPPGVWEYNGEAWTMIETEASSIWGHTMTYDPVQQVTVLFGGDPFPTYRHWDGKKWIVSVVNVPFFFYDRMNTAMAYDTHRSRLVGFGGVVLHTWFSETWEVTPENQVLEVDPAPHPDGDPPMAYDSSRHLTLLVDHRVAGRVWEYDGEDERWTVRDGPGPAAWRSADSVVFDSKREVLVLFGGQIASQPQDDLWEWDGETWVQRLEPGPTARADHAMAFDAARGECVLFGGNTSGWPSPMVLTGETWTFDGSAWTLASTAGPSPRIGAAMAFDPLREVVVLFGGTTGGGPAALLGDTWEWDGRSWTHIAAAGPSARSDHAMTFDAKRRAVVLYGGAVAHSLPGALGASAEVWIWNGKIWTQLEDAPKSIDDAGLVFDTERERLITFGGGGGSSSKENRWLEYGNDLHFIAHPTPRRVLAGQTATFTTSAESASPVFFQWRKDGVAIDGATGQQLVIKNVSPDDEADYDVVISNECGSRRSPPAALTIGESCAPDIEPAGGNGVIDINDLIAVILGWGACPPPPEACPDTNADGVVNIDDLIVIIDAWGACIE
jgi:hypothetical protein